MQIQRKIRIDASGDYHIIGALRALLGGQKIGSGTFSFKIECSCTLYVIQTTQGRYT